ncbi:MAG: HAD hydrolase-like protein [Atopobiaceae bacterium]|nr:HAD hydrolase-like protein [Atopobiaceae bacterium]
MITWTDDIDVAARHLVLFDFDGTIADTKPTIVKTASRVLLDFGIDQQTIATKVDGIIGPPFPEAFSLVFGVSTQEAEAITQAYRAHYFTLGPEAWPLFEGMRELLGRLRAAGYLTAVASSKLQRAIDQGVDDNDLRGQFDAIVGKRPGVVDTKAEAIQAVMDYLSCTAEETIMVGDRFHDVEGARVCGVPCIGVLFGDTGTREELEQAGAIVIVDTTDELSRVLLGEARSPAYSQPHGPISHLHR